MAAQKKLYTRELTEMESAIREDSCEAMSTSPRETETIMLLTEEYMSAGHHDRTLDVKYCIDDLVRATDQQAGRHSRF